MPSCKHPLKGWIIGKTAQGKDQYLITSYETDHVELQRGKWMAVPDKRISPYAEAVRYTSREIPCGQCYACRLQYSREWADRCMMEMQYHDESWFLTLTYDDEHLPIVHGFDKETGEVFDFMSLQKKDLQDFNKRLRSQLFRDYKKAHPGGETPPRFRFYACGEYGDRTYRPHFHGIYFGLAIPDLEFYRSDGRFSYYTSEYLKRIWQRGFVVVARACWETAAYCARYVMKKSKGMNKAVYDDFGIEPEFVLMSRGGSSPDGNNLGGIGKRYFDEHGKEMFEYDRVYVDTGKDSKEFVPPRYFKKLFDKVDAAAASQKVQERMAKATAKMLLKRGQTSQSYLELLQTEEDALKRKTSVLQRKEF